jgi:hypothetical protein
MSYPSIDKTPAETLLSAYRTNGIYDAAKYVRSQGSGESEIEGVNFTRLHNDLKNILVGPLPKGEKQDAYFEMMACSVMHRSLGKLSVVAASDPRFWMWLTFASYGKKMVELVDLRIKKGDSIPAEVNFGITTRANVYEALYARLWWRGYRFFDSSADNPYELAERGDIDFWRSHILRQNFSRADAMTRAFVKFILPDHKRSSGLDTDLMRGVAKKLKARYTSCCFEALDEEQCRQILIELATEVRDEAAVSEVNSVEKAAQGKEAKNKKRSAKSGGSKSRR